MTGNSILLYKTLQGQIKVIIQDKNVWMTQMQIGELFGKDRSSIAKHILNIYSEGELKEENTTSLIKANVQKVHNSFNKPTNYYNLDLIFAVGYRVRGSEKAIAFRTWATSILKEYSLRGFVMDDQRLENGNTINGKIDFELLLQKVREIRFSEKQTYEKIKDLFTTSIDYDPRNKITKDFFAKIQNKFVYAITGHTTAELIVNRVSANQQGLGMKSSKKEIVTKKEATIGKNYLLEKELKHLYLLCEQFFSSLVLLQGKEKYN